MHVRCLLSQFIRDLGRFPVAISDESPWRVVNRIGDLVRTALGALPGEFELRSAEVAVHRSAAVAGSAVLTGPVIVSAGCRIGPGAVLRGRVWADEDVTIGPNSEIKSSLIFAGSAAAHRNYAGDSVIGRNINLEAGRSWPTFRRAREQGDLRAGGRAGHRDGPDQARRDSRGRHSDRGQRRHQPGNPAATRQRRPPPGPDRTATRPPATDLIRTIRRPLDSSPGERAERRERSTLGLLFPVVFVVQGFG